MAKARVEVELEEVLGKYTGVRSDLEVTAKYLEDF